MGGFLIWLIIFCIIVGSNISKEKKKAEKRNLNRPQMPPQMPQEQYTTAAQQRMPQQPQRTMTQQRMPQQPQRTMTQQNMTQQPKKASSQQKMPEWLKNSGVYRPGDNKAQKPQQDIVERAKINNSHFDEDETLAEIEKMHGHKENEAPVKIEHEAVCMTHKVEADADFPQESMFGSVDDLIAKGYDGNMNFDRDFIAEAMEMINNCNYSV